jgi:predicted permease
MMFGFAGDLKAAVRKLIAAPLFTGFAVLSLAVGVGVTTAAYSIVEDLFFKDLGIADPDRLLYVVTPGGGRMLSGAISDPDFLDLRAAQRSFSSIASSSTLLPAVTTKTTTALLRAEVVDGAYFTTLGVGARLGRVFQSSEDAAPANLVVLSHRLWRTRFASDPAIAGQVIHVAGQPFEIIGVAAEGFEGPRGAMMGTDLWIPRSAEKTLSVERPSVPARDFRRLVVFGRLGPNATAASASLELQQIARNLDASFPTLGFGKPGVSSERQWSARSADDLGDEGEAMRRFGLTLIGLVGLVLVVACTNLANLVLARGTERQQEITVRFALGASRWRLIRGQIAESLILAATGGVAAFMVFRGLQLLLHTEFNMGFAQSGQISIAIDPQLNTNALMMAVASLLLSLLVFGVEPAIQLTRTVDLRGELAIGGNPRARRQRILLRWQVLTATGFFIVSTMLVKYMVIEMRHDPGVELDRMGVATVNFGIQGWDEGRARRALDRVLDIASHQPGVEAVAISTSMPFGTPYSGRIAMYAAGQVSSGYNGQRGMLVASTPSMFKVMGVAIKRGRSFDERDNAAGARVVIISEFTARQVFGDSEPIGRELVIDEPQKARQLVTVVGVAANTDVGMILSDPHAFAYVPFAQRYDPMIAIAARSTGAPGAAVAALRDALRAADPEMAVNVIGPARTVLAGPFAFLRGVGLSTVGLGALTLLLAMVGLFGIQTHIVARRTREIGVRMSFGATAQQIRWMILSDGARPVLDGMLLGLVAGLIGRLFVRNYLSLTNVAVIDAWAFVLIPIPMILASFCACYLPARRAASVDPNVALRHL